MLLKKVVRLIKKGFDEANRQARFDSQRRLDEAQKEAAFEYYEPIAYMLMDAVNNIAASTGLIPVSDPETLITDKPVVFSHSYPIALQYKVYIRGGYIIDVAEIRRMLQYELNLIATSWGYPTLNIHVIKQPGYNFIAIRVMDAAAVRAYNSAKRSAAAVAQRKQQTTL